MDFLLIGYFRVGLRKKRFSIEFILLHAFLAHFIQETETEFWSLQYYQIVFPKGNSVDTVDQHLHCVKLQWDRMPGKCDRLLLQENMAFFHVILYEDEFI